MPRSDAYKLCVAPMMDWTDRHCRYFHRLLAPDARVYTEMVTTGALLHGDRERLLAFSAAEHPVALQLGGSEPEDLAASARIAADYGYDEVNLNVGCPSQRVQRGAFGACLMKEPELVRDCVAAMREAVNIPVTVKTRLGVDDFDSWAFLSDFVGAVAESGVDIFIIHARKAWLQGLSPRQNRELPPLDYERVDQLKRCFPGLTVLLNGGLADAEAVELALDRVDGVMLGRAAYQNPWLLARLQRRLFPRQGPATRAQAVAAMADYADRAAAAGVALHHVARHMLGLFRGCPGGKRWRRLLSEGMHEPGADSGLLLRSCPEPLAVAAA